MVSQHGMVMCVRVVDQLCVGGSGVRVDPVGAVVPDAAVLILDGYSECCVRRRIREIVSEERSCSTGSRIRISGLAEA